MPTLRETMFVVAMVFCGMFFVGSMFLVSLGRSCDSGDVGITHDSIEECFEDQGTRPIDEVEWALFWVMFFSAVGGGAAFYKLVREEDDVEAPEKSGR